LTWKHFTSFKSDVMLLT